MQEAPRIRRQPILGRGPRALQPLLNPKETQNIPRPRKYLGTNVDGPSLRQVIALGNELEWRIFWALLTHQLMPDHDFDYQAPQMGGRLELGGLVLDFYLPGHRLGLNPLGAFWHLRTRAQQARDLLQSAQLAGFGITVILIDEEDGMTRPRGVVAAALRGEDQSTSTSGF